MYHPPPISGQRAFFQKGVGVSTLEKNVCEQKVCSQRVFFEKRIGTAGVFYRVCFGLFMRHLACGVWGSIKVSQMFCPWA